MFRRQPGWTWGNSKKKNLPRPILNPANPTKHPFREKLKIALKDLILALPTWPFAWGQG